MMKHSKVVPLVILEEGSFSILEIAELIVGFYKGLSECDSNYNHVYTISEKTPLHEIIDVQDANSIHLLAEELLHQNIDDIRKIDGVENPDQNYRRGKNGGLSLGLQTKAEGETFITLNFSFYPNQSAVGSIAVNELCFDSYVKAMDFLEIANSSFLVKYSVIKIMDRSLNKVARGYLFPLGWITYFSESLNDLIPDGLEGVSYECSDRGKYVILSKESISVDSDKLDSGKEVLIKCMKQIEEQNPAYSKGFIPPFA